MIASYRGAVVGTLLALVSTVSSSRGADNDLREQIHALQDGQEAIRTELNQIRDLLLGKQPPLDNVTVNTDQLEFRGSAEAKIGIVEFADFQCPYCGRYFKDVYPLLDSEYVKTGKIRYMFRNFPLESIHAQASKAAEAGRCAAAQGKLFEMHDRLFQHQEELGVAQLSDHARAIGLDGIRFQLCMDTSAELKSLKNDIEEGNRLGVEATPTFFLGTLVPGNKVMKATVLLKGSQPYPAFRDALEKLVSEH